MSANNQPMTHWDSMILSFSIKFKLTNIGMPQAEIDKLFSNTRIRNDLIKFTHIWGIDSITQNINKSGLYIDRGGVIYR